MRCRLFPLVVAFVASSFLSVYAEDFETDVPAKVTYSETYNDTIVKDPDFDYAVIPSTTLKVTTVCSMKGVDLSSIDKETDVSIDFGGLSGAWTLGDDPTYRKGNTSATIPLLGTDPVSGNEVRVGKVSLLWDSKTVTITVTAQNDPDTYQVLAADVALGGEATNNYRDVSLVTFTFGDRELTGRNVYIHGAVSYEDYEKGDISETLAHVNLGGELDSTPPALQILAPQGGEKVHAPNYTISGTASDEHGIAAVFVKFNGAAEQEVTLSSVGAWTLPVTLNEGSNTVEARAVDQDGNVTSLGIRTVTFAPLIDLTVKAEGTASGQVSSEFFPAFTYTPGVASPEIVTKHEAGETLVLTATPAPGSLFDGWVSNVSLPDASSPHLSVTMQPGLTLTARFVPNVFLPVRGTYSGLLESSDPEGRGSIMIKLGGEGSFSGTVHLGILTMRLKGVFGSDGKFTGTARARGQLFDVTLGLPAPESPTKQITGSFQPHVASSQGSQPAFQSTITADLAVFKKRVREVGGQLTGSYNVLISPAAENADPDFPVGIGFGRVTLSRFGTAKLVGKLGDGTAVTASSPISEDANWSLYAPLDEKKGTLIGRVKFDPLQPDSDVSGLLNWSRPARAEPLQREGFAGQAHLTGAKYVSRVVGRVFLNPSGAGQLSLSAPLAGGTEIGVVLPDLALDSAATLSSMNQLRATNPALSVKAKVDPATGFFAGSFFDASQQTRVPFSGAVVIGGTDSAPKGNVAGGFFSRGNRTGSVQIVAPALPTQ